MIVVLDADNVGPALDAKCLDLTLLGGGKDVKVARNRRDNSLGMPFKGWKG